MAILAIEPILLNMSWGPLEAFFHGDRKWTNLGPYHITMSHGDMVDQVIGQCQKNQRILILLNR